jgi:quercetin dioxygenase-like cupin family protein
MGNTGWHMHPGPSLITVTAGTITAYDGDDPTCAPRTFIPKGVPSSTQAADTCIFCGTKAAARR